MERSEHKFMAELTPTVSFWFTKAKQNGGG